MNSPRRISPRRVAVIALAGLAAIYVLFTITGYLWVNFGLKNHQITFAQVAFLRFKEVRRDLARQQLAEAKAAFDRKDFSGAYLAYASALRNDPDNVDTRIEAARFFAAVGAVKVSLSTLEDGLSRSSDSRLVNQMLELLLSTGADSRALELLHGRFADGYSGANGLRLKTYEVQATLTSRGPDAAEVLVERYPEIAGYPDAIPVIAQVQWGRRERLKAIQTLSEYVAQGRGNLAVYSILCGWQQAAGMVSDAQQTARLACTRLPDDPAPRILLIGALQPASPEWSQAVQTCLEQYGSSPDTLIRLSNLAGERGWVEFARTLYVVGANRLVNPALLALTYADALMHAGRFADARQTLAELESQVSDSDARMMALVRDQQIVASAALGDQDGVRDFARRLAVILGDDPDAIEQKRRRYAQLNIQDAVIELSKVRSAPTGKKPGS